MKDRREDRKIETDGPAPPLEARPRSGTPERDGSDLLDFHGTRLRSAPAARFYPLVAVMRAIHAGASKVSEPVLQPSPPEVFRYPALRLVGQPVAAPQRLFGVLLVDDSPHHRILLLRALRHQGHSVLHAADGASGEALCRASELEIDALVACADMKRMCGFELARRVGRMRPG